jgi:hypothetical protein
LAGFGGEGRVGSCRHLGNNSTPASLLKKQRPGWVSAPDPTHAR